MKLTRVNLGAILRQMPDVNKVRQKFITKLLPLFWLIPKRINFLQMGRWGSYNECTYRAHFEEFFDFAMFNTALVKEYGSGYTVLAFDPSYIRKSGKQTPYKGFFWSGCDQKAKPGLEISCLSAVDIARNTAYHLDAVQTPDSQTLADDGGTLLQHYIKMMVIGYDKCAELSNILTADGFFAKKEVVDTFTLQTDGIFISKLRSDANLKYLYLGEHEKRRGPKRKFTGKVDLKQIDTTYFQVSYTDDEITIYDAIVFSVALKRNIRVAYVQYYKIQDGKRVATNRQIYFSSCLAIPAWYIAKFYKHRFQQEFINRDAKQFTGLCDGQARSLNKLDFHFNAACTAVSVAKLEHELAIVAEQKDADSPFSMADVKVATHNQYIVEQIFSMLQHNPNLQINSKEVQNLIFQGAIAA